MPKQAKTDLQGGKMATREAEATASEETFGKCPIGKPTFYRGINHAHSGGYFILAKGGSFSLVSKGCRLGYSIYTLFRLLMEAQAVESQGIDRQHDLRFRP